MSHKLRAALAVILSATEVLLGDDRLSDKQKARVQRVERAARDMAELGTALLLMAREDHAQPGGDQVAEVIEDAVEGQRHVLGSKPIVVDLQTGPARVVAADCGLVDILVSNLVRNAFSYTGARQRHRALGQPQPRHFRHRPRHPRRSHRPGMPAPLPRHHQHRVGIGLSLVKRICDRYGWRAGHQRDSGVCAVGNVAGFGQERTLSLVAETSVCRVPARPVI